MSPKSDNTGMRNRALFQEADDKTDVNCPPEDKKRFYALRCLAMVVCLLLFRSIRKLISRGIGLVIIFVMMLKASRYYSDYLGSLEYMAPIIEVERVCPKATYDTLDTPGSAGQICLTTLTDEKHRSTSQKLLGWRNYQGVLGFSWKNKQDYANKHGYSLFDESDQVDESRPPGWSKILATRRLLKEENCSWVFWLDADTIIMDSDRRVEEFIPSDPTKDFVITSDLNNTKYNNGVWLIRNSEWGHDFLDSWWSMTTYIHPVGMASSGDQHSMNALLQERDELSEKGHGVKPPQCTFNSFTNMVKPFEQAEQLLVANITEQSYYMSEYYYHKGDFLAHAAGVENKVGVLKKMLQLAT
jgi:hypothetical protein